MIRPRVSNRIRLHRISPALLPLLVRFDAYLTAQGYRPATARSFRVWVQRLLLAGGGEIRTRDLPQDLGNDARSEARRAIGHWKRFGDTLR